MSNNLNNKPEVPGIKKSSRFLRYAYEAVKATLILCALYLFAWKMYQANINNQKAQFYANFETISKSCLRDHYLTDQDIDDFWARKIPSGPNAPCYLACLMRQMGVVDDTGMLNKETALILAKSIFDSDEAQKAIANDIHSCSHINSASVSDKEKGCDRAMLAYKCMIENDAQFQLFGKKTQMPTTSSIIILRIIQLGIVFVILRYVIAIN